METHFGVFWVSGILGTGLLLLGLIGRSIKCPPYCRNCRYNLERTAGAEACPECGARLTFEGAVRHTKRKRRPRVAIAGVVVIFVCMGIITPAVLQKMGAVDLYHYAPTSLLLRFASGGKSPEAVYELYVRCADDRLSEAQIIGVIEMALTMQADWSKPWDVNWGNIIETADAGDLVTAEQMARYAQAAIVSTTSVHMRKRVRKGDPIPYRMYLSGPSRVGDKGLWLRRTGKNLRVGDVDLKLQGSSGGRIKAIEQGDGYSSSAQWEPQLDAIAPGIVDTAVTLHLAVYRDPIYSNATPALYEYDCKFLTKMTVTAADEPTAKFVTDPSARSAMVAAFPSGRQVLDYNTNNGWLNATINVTGAPYASAFEVWLERDGKRWHVSSVNFDDYALYGHGTGAKLEDFDADVVDVVLEPSLDAAAATVDRTAIWGERIVIKDVKVNRR